MGAHLPGFFRRDKLLPPFPGLTLSRLHFTKKVTIRLQEGVILFRRCLNQDGQDLCLQAIRRPHFGLQQPFDIIGRPALLKVWMAFLLRLLQKLLHALQQLFTLDICNDPDQLQFSGLNIHTACRFVQR